MNPHITVEFVGKHPIDWDPAVVLASDKNVDTFVDRGPNPLLLSFLQTRIDEADAAGGESSSDYIDAKANLVLIRDLILEPNTGTFIARQAGDSEDSFNVWLLAMERAVMKLQKGWNPTPKISNTSKVSRDAADRKAQSLVPKMYNNRCILTGTAKPQGAHIVPVRAKDIVNTRTWDALSMFLPLPKNQIQGLVIPGHEHENILPMTHTMHAFWDLYYFALRPVVHPHDPVHRLYLQLVWLKDPEGGRIEAGQDWQHARFGGGCDYRRAGDGDGGGNEKFPSLQQGSVYELVTQDPVACPVPNTYFLQLQYGVHRIMAGIQAAGSLKTIFNHQPPPDPDQGEVPAEDTNTIALDDIDRLPPRWHQMLEAALDASVMDERTALRWGKSFARDQMKKDLEDMRFWRRQQKVAEGNEVESSDNGYDDDDDDDDP